LNGKSWMIAGLGLAVLSAGARGFDFQEKSAIRDAYAFPASATAIEVSVDNIEGSITVSGIPGRTVELLANQTIRAESPARLQLAKEEVQLKITKRESLFDALVDAPWRCEDGRRSRERRDPGYRVRFDFDLKAPSEARIILRNINDGEIKVTNLNGDYDVKNINGGIDMAEISGSGRVYALNGKVTVVFRDNPVRDSYFGSLNGDVDLHFLPGLAADLRLKTFNGGIYSDFSVTGLPAKPLVKETRGGKQVYKADRFFAVRVGQGGPEIELDGFNGDIRLHERKR